MGFLQCLIGSTDTRVPPLARDCYGLCDVVRHSGRISNENGELRFFH
jgi:hypothetical protein